jgi:putative ABC transport system permease protein
MGRRDVARHRGRSALIVLMVAIPVLIIVAGNILYSTEDLTPSEALPFTLGQTQARVTVEGGKVDPAGPFFGITNPLVTSDKAKPIPGWGEDLKSQTQALSTLMGGTAYPSVPYQAQALVGRAVRDVGILGIDAASHRSSAGITDLISGRWPMREDEAVVTPAGIALGLPNAGTIKLTIWSPTSESNERTVTVVGVATAYINDFRVRAAELVMLPQGDSGMAVMPMGFLIERSTPVTYEETQRLAEHGVAVTSRALVLDPPRDVKLGPEFSQIGIQDNFTAGQTMASVFAAMGLLLETVLLAGPAFAVGAARQRRTLALAASNGATQAQLLRTVLGQALVLGALSAIVGGVLGIAGAGIAVAITRQKSPGTLFGPFDIPTGPVLLVVGCAVVAALVAAWVPSRGLGRLDIIGVLRGQTVSPPARVRTPIFGLTCFGIGAVAVFWSTTVKSFEDTMGALAPYAALLGAVLLVIGALLLVPMVLAGLARAATAAPVALRMAFRDASRQRGRATSTVAAILGVTSVLGAVLIIAASDTAYRGRTYTPQAADGQGTISPRFTLGDSAGVDSASIKRVTSAVRGVDPALVVAPLSMVDSSPRGIGPRPTADVVEKRIVALRTGCSATLALSLDMTPASLPCISLNSQPYMAERSGIQVASLDVLVARFNLTPAEAAVLTKGGIIVNGDPAPPPPTATTTPGGGWAYRGMLVAQTDVRDGVVTFVRGTVTYPTGPGPQDAPKGEVLDTFTMPALAIPASRFGNGAEAMGPPRMTGAIMTTETAATRSFPTIIQTLMLTDPRGPINADTENALKLTIVEDGLGYLYIERGFQPYDKLLAAIVLGVMGLLILVATLVSTALSTAETAPLMGTFAAVGATRTTRRNIAAAQAFSLGLVGALLGLLVGAVPGISIARATTMQPQGYAGYSETPLKEIDPTIVIPWLQFAVPIIVVPLVAAAIAWLAIRSAPQVTRRLT